MALASPEGHKFFLSFRTDGGLPSSFQSPGTTAYFSPCWPISALSRGALVPMPHLLHCVACPAPRGHLTWADSIRGSQAGCSSLLHPNPTPRRWPSLGPCHASSAGLQLQPLSPSSKDGVRWFLGASAPVRPSNHGHGVFSFPAPLLAQYHTAMHTALRACMAPSRAESAPEAHLPGLMQQQSPSWQEC